MEVFCASPWVPAEWIRAHGLAPRLLSAAPGLRLDSSAEGVCPFAEATVRAREEQAGAAFIFSTHCDQLRRGFDHAQSSQDRVFLFNLPSTWQTPVAARLFEDELERLSRFLVAMGGHPPAPGELQAAWTADQGHRQRLLEAATHLDGRAYAEAVARFHSGAAFDPLPTGSRRAESAIPLALVGGPLPRSQWVVFDVLEQAGARVVVNAMDDGERGLGAAPEIDVPNDARTLTAHCLARCVDVWQRPNDRIYLWLRRRLAVRRVRAIVLWHYPGCDLWRAETETLREAFGLPVLAIEGGFVESLMPRIKTRVEALLESLR